MIMTIVWSSRHGLAMGKDWKKENKTQVSDNDDLLGHEFDPKMKELDTEKLFIYKSETSDLTESLLMKLDKRRILVYWM